MLFVIDLLSLLEYLVGLGDVCVASDGTTQPPPRPR
jgi:hypothetical protein